jgi:1,4-dihydroxy-2-naphthoyl-CoA hydrolase
VTGGWVYGEARPLHLGRTTHVWEVRITNEEGKLVCISRMTAAVLSKPSEYK